MKENEKVKEISLKSSGMTPSSAKLSAGCFSAECERTSLSFVIILRQRASVCAEYTENHHLKAVYNLGSVVQDLSFSLFLTCPLEAVGRLP